MYVYWSEFIKLHYCNGDMQETRDLLEMFVHVQAVCVCVYI